MEPCFGHDFSRVRVHTDGQAGESARAVDALAYTVGRNVVFGPGQYAPEERAGRSLLAHELTHVVQQRNSPAHESAELSIGPTQSAAEAEADCYANQVADGGSKTRVGNAIPSRQLQRKGTTFGGFLGNLFHFWDYSEATLQTYLGVLDRTKDIEDDDDSDDKARQIVRAWKSGASKFALTPQRKALLILEMLSGRVLGSDQEGVLTLLDRATDAELSYVFGAGRVRHVSLLSKFGTLKKELLDFYRRRYGTAEEKEIKDDLKPLRQPENKPPDRKLTFAEALVEGANILHAAGFGKVCGNEKGPDEGDGYDARYWTESGREKLVATIEPWMAFKNLLRDLGKDVPNATGGSTKWSFDCYGFVITNEVYADWRTLTRDEFNQRHSPLQLGIFSHVDTRWEASGIRTTKPGQKPFQDQLGHSEAGMSEITSRITFNKPMSRLLAEAPIGSRVTWTNLDALKKCEASKWTLDFCNYVHENTLKVGPDQYSAHPFGIVAEKVIKEEMAKAVFSDRPVPKGYIEKNIIVALIRRPTEQASTAA